MDRQQQPGPAEPPQIVDPYGNPIYSGLSSATSAPPSPEPEAAYKFWAPIFVALFIFGASAVVVLLVAIGQTPSLEASNWYNPAIVVCGISAIGGFAGTLLSLSGYSPPLPSRASQPRWFWGSFGVLLLFGLAIIGAVLFQKMSPEPDAEQLTVTAMQPYFPKTSAGQPRIEASTFYENLGSAGKIKIWLCQDDTTQSSVQRVKDCAKQRFESDAPFNEIEVGLHGKGFFNVHGPPLTDDKFNEFKLRKFAWTAAGYMQLKNKQGTSTVSFCGIVSAGEAVGDCD